MYVYLWYNTTTPKNSITIPELEHYQFFGIIKEESIPPINHSLRDLLSIKYLKHHEE